MQNTYPITRPISATRAAANRANSLHSTGPRTEAGKRHSSRNAITHGLTSRTAVLPSEDPAEYHRHLRSFHDEYHPATPTENQLVEELATVAWRLNRIPQLEADALSRAQSLAPSPEPPTFDIVDAHRAIAALGLHGQRLSRQFHKTLDRLRSIQTDRLEREQRAIKEAAVLFEHHKHKAIPFDPAEYGFVFSISEIERASARLIRRNEARQVECVLFHTPFRPLNTGASAYLRMSQ